MENKAKNLEATLNSVLANKTSEEVLAKVGLLQEFKRLQLGLKYMNEKGIRPVSVDGFGILSRCLSDRHAKTMDMKIALHVAQTSLLLSLSATIDSLEVFEPETKAQKNSAKKTANDVLMVAGEILPDVLNSAYDLIQDGNGSSKIYDEKGQLIFDLEEFFNGVIKSGHKSAVLNNLATANQDAETNFRRVVKKNVKDFLMLVPAIEKEVGVSVASITSGSVTEPIVSVNTKVRKFRRENRPVDKKGYFLPSYVDYLGDGAKETVPFDKFKETPTGKILNEFKSEFEYNKYVKSTAFWAYVSHLETPIERDESGKVDTSISVMALKTNEEGKLEIVEDVTDADCKLYHKEKILLPKKAFKRAKKVESETAEISKVKNVKELKAVERVMAGALAVVLIAATIGWPVKQIIESIRDNEPGVEQGPTEVIPPEETTTPEPGSNNVEITTDPEEIVTNPAESINPPEETTTPEEETTAPEEETTTPEEETTTPEEETTTPEEETTAPEEETTIPEETEDPSQDNPEVEVPDHNDIDEDRREEDQEDGFWFE